MRRSCEIGTTGGTDSLSWRETICWKGVVFAAALFVSIATYSQTTTTTTTTTTNPTTTNPTTTSPTTTTQPAPASASASSRDTIQTDTLNNKSGEAARFPVKRTVPEEYDDLIRKRTSDLRDPENIKTVVEYDERTNSYLLRSKVGDVSLGTPLRMTPEEYQRYTMKKSLDAYFQSMNREALDSLNGVSGGRRGGTGNSFNPLDLKFDIGAMDKIFGPGGVKLTSQGTIGMDIGLKTSSTNNPALPERSRSRTFFNFDTDVQMTTRASVGNKVNFDLNYNTGAQFDFDQSKLRLNYAGEEDEIVKSLEGGNVSLNTNNSLIRGGSALFGVKTDLQFGKLRVKAIVAQQESDAMSVTSKGGSQMTEYEFSADSYDDNRHYFLAHYFRDAYDRSMSKLPYISSGVQINRIEVWVTNKSGNYGQSRNIVSFTDLGEREHISNPLFTPTGSIETPYNNANTLYRTVVDNYQDAREISHVTQVLDAFIEGGRDYEKIESARLLSTSDYTLNSRLGYISLNAKLQNDEALAVAYEYIYNGTVYQVGEFSSDNSENATGCLYLKTLKGTSMSPSQPYWDLMMKNIYKITGAYSIQSAKFRLDIVYQSDTAGTYVYSIPEGDLKDKTLLKVMNLDRLNSQNEAVPGGGGDGFFDYVEGFTINSSNGLIIFPVVEPFGSHLRQAIGNDAVADKYVYQELYDSTLTYAKQIAEKNKFKMKGRYAGSSSNVIQVGGSNIARGSVTVRANGIVLVENVDYTVNYSSGTVTILNEALISSNAQIDVSLENQATMSMQRKTMFGADLSYALSKDLTIGGTIMHLSEMPQTTKTAFGQESVNNTLWGFNFDYKGQSQWLTNMFDKLPLLELSQPSTYSINAEFAHLIAGHYTNQYVGEYSYLDDFESTQYEIDLLNPYYWNLASTPYEGVTGRFPEASLTNNIDYGKNRALLAWYYIDGLFTRRNSSLRPSYMTNDDISNHYVRAVLSEELFPNRDLIYSDNNYLNVLNLAYYPKERGPYNLDADNINSDGTLGNPEKRWGGMMRSIDQTDFEQANIQYIEFWLMDPFIYEPSREGGDLYFNLGEISEDILRDEKKFFENGLPVNGDETLIDTTVWGKVPRQQSTVYAFDNSAGARALQDVGLNGLSSTEEKSFPTYQTYLQRLRQNVSAETITRMESDKFSPLNDPAGDDFAYFRNYDYDAMQADILTRYKRYNGVEGNSRESSETSESYGTSSKMTPDVEDFNMDNTLNENEKYYQYRVSIRPKDLVVGTNYIVDKRTSNVRLQNGTREDVAWYQFKIPIREYTAKVGSIADFSSIRFMRVYMTDFKETTVLRFGKFALVRGEWRPYEQALYRAGASPSTAATLSIATVNVEENGDREPVNYVLPPGVTRITDPSQPQLRQQNEQSLSMKVTGLASQDARAIYKTTSFDLRRYRRIQLFIHAERLVEDATNLENGELSAFIRLGSDYKNNYYEYEIPLTLTEFGTRDRSLVWPSDNMMNFPLEALTNLKLARNRAKSKGEGGVTYATLYSEYDPENTRNTISIVGNPSLAEVQVIMIGVRNNSKDVKSAEVWVNELRVTDYDETGGWAANANMNLQLSDLATINATGNIETAGFGSLDQSVSERTLDDFKQYSIAATIQLQKFFPEKLKLSLPLYYALSREVLSPQYNPIDQDVLLQESIDSETTKAGKDSIRSFSYDVHTTKALALNNIRFDIRSKTPMPYDPANFSLGYASNVETRTNPETEYETTSNFRGNLDYMYVPYFTPLSPFKNLKMEKGFGRYLKQLQLNYFPQSITLHNTFTRDYYEIKLRDLNDVGTRSDFPVSFSQNFLWDRAFEVRWNPLSSITFNFSSGTNARIEEAFLQVNREQNPDDYARWKDTVLKSIADLGTPLLYDQQAAITYSPPLNLIPVFDWVTTNFSYTATYNWEKGAYIDEFTDLGNSIRNKRDFAVQGNFNLVQLYNKNAFLKKTLQKASVTPTRQSATAAKQKKPEVKPKPRTLTVEVKLNPDSGAIVQHNMLTKKVMLRARRADDTTKRVSVTYKALDYARIRVFSKDTCSIKLTVREMPSQDTKTSYKVFEYAARMLMLVRKIGFSYALSDGMYIPGFTPMIGSWFGQGATSVGRAPGWGFAFGDVRRSYLDEASDNGWLLYNTDNITPALLNHTKTFSANASLELIPAMKITLTANYTDSRDNEIQFMSAGMPETLTGNFTMSTVGLGGFFAGAGDARKRYKSDVFNRMMSYRDVIHSRINSLYVGTRYPDKGFLAGTIYPSLETGYDPAIGSMSKNSGDVLIPAFIAAYTNRKPEKVGLTAFPSLTSVLPNWDVSYDGLTRINAIAAHVKTLTVKHKYSCTYSIGSYTSYLSKVSAGIGGDLGYIPSADNGAPIPSMGYEIASVNLNETFNPLLGLDATLLNDMTAGVKYNKSRVINLNVTSYRMVEAFTDDITFSLGYKYPEFNKVLKLKNKKNDFSNDLTVRCDYSYRKTLSLIRNLDDDNTQATQGSKGTTMSFSAEYAASKRVNLRAFYDLQINTPLVSSTAYPTSNSNYGVSIQVSLDQ